jgi:hypothetical protein
MTQRKPQINFQVEPSMKLLYEEAKACGHRTTCLCAAGLLVMVEDGCLRLDALRRLRDWETRYAGAPPEVIQAFVRGAGRRLERRVRRKTRTRDASCPKPE